MSSLRRPLASLLLAAFAVACGPKMPSGETLLLVLTDGVQLNGDAMTDVDGATRISLAHLDGEELDLTIRLEESVPYRRLPEFIGWLSVGPEQGLHAEVQANGGDGAVISFPLGAAWVYLPDSENVAVTNGSAPIFGGMPKEELAAFARGLLAERPAAHVVVATDTGVAVDAAMELLVDAGAGSIHVLAR